MPATREAGPQLLEAEIDYLVFTGSANVGRQIAKRLGERLIPSTLELSGCDAMFVLADANAEFAAKKLLLPYDQFSFAPTARSGRQGSAHV